MGPEWPLSVIGAVAVATGKNRYQRAAWSNPDPCGMREGERGNGLFGARADKIQLRLAQRGFGKAVLKCGEWPFFLHPTASLTMALSMKWE